jgi:hypothetical protein
MKKCPHCKHYHEKWEFNKKGKTGLSCYCKYCNADYLRSWRKKDENKSL